MSTGVKKFKFENQIGVLLSTRGGWFTKHKSEKLLFDPIIIKLLLEHIKLPDENKTSFHNYVKFYLTAAYSDLSFSEEEINALSVTFIPKGRVFTITNVHDGIEYLNIIRTDGLVPFKA